MKKIIALIFFITPLAAICQNLTGTWVGSGGGTTYIKMVITHRGDSLFGYTYDEGEGFCKATFLGSFDRKIKRLTGNGVKMIERTPNHVLVDYDLHYSKSPDGEYLNERSGGGLLQEIFSPLSSPLHLKKISKRVDNPYTKKVVSTPRPAPVNRKPEIKPVAPVAVKPKPQPVKPKTNQSVVIVPKPVAKPKPVITRKKEEPAVKTDSVAIRKVVTQKQVRPEPLLKIKEERASKLVETIYTDADTLKIAVYDNGEVDGDTVTVFLDNAVVLDRYRISEKAKVLYVPIKDGQTRVIDLFANNLGSIPPNTALIIVTAGKKRYELHASYDLKTNARIVIQYRE